MPNILWTVLLLLCSNIFMTFAWYMHLKNLKDTNWIWAVLASWGIAFFEYLIMVPANRIGYETASVAQLKIIQEAVTLTVFIPFAIFYMREPFRMDFVWAGLCIMGAVYFMFRGA